MITISRIIQFIIGFLVSVPFLWDIKGTNGWAEEMMGKGFANTVAILFFIMGIRALALMMDSPNTWGERGFVHSARVREFRENALKGMSINDGARLLRDTAALDIPNEFGPESATGRTRRFMDAKFAGMTPAQGIEWLRGKEK